MDGIDGIATCQGIVATAVWFVIALNSGNELAALLALATLGGLAAFLIWDFLNNPPWSCPSGIAGEFAWHRRKDLAAFGSKILAPAMIVTDPDQTEFASFCLPFSGKLKASNRWVKLAAMVPWDEVERCYAESLSGSGMGAPAKSGRSHRIDDRIVSVSQPHMRPIVRGKAGKSVEFGARHPIDRQAFRASAQGDRGQRGRTEGPPPAAARGRGRPHPGGRQVRQRQARGHAGAGDGQALACQQKRDPRGDRGAEPGHMAARCLFLASRIRLRLPIVASGAIAKPRWRAEARLDGSAAPSPNLSRLEKAARLIQETLFMGDSGMLEEREGVSLF